MYEITDLSDSGNSSELKGETGTIPKIEALGYNDFPSDNTYSSHMGDNVASSSGSNIRSSLLIMGFPPSLVDKAIRQNGEDNADLLLETLFAYSVLQKPKPEFLDSANGSFCDMTDGFAGDRLKQALHRSHSESSDSLDSFFGDEKDISSPVHISASIHLKEVEVVGSTARSSSDFTFLL